MSYPTEIDFGQILIGDGATPTEVFTVLCGFENGQVNKGVESTKQFRRDCAKPGQVPTGKVKVTGKTWGVTANGVFNAAMVPTLDAALGISKNYKIICCKRDGTDAGLLLGTYSGPLVLTTNNMSFSQSEGTGEITMDGENFPTWTPNP